MIAQSCSHWQKSLLTDVVLTCSEIGNPKRSNDWTIDTITVQKLYLPLYIHAILIIIIFSRTIIYTLGSNLSANYHRAVRNKMQRRWVGVIMSTLTNELAWQKR